MKKKIAAIALSSVIAVSGLSALSAGVSAEWVKSGSSYSYTDDDGNVLKGWQEIDGGKYYFDKNGKALTGWYKIGGKKYYFNGAKKGKMVTGTVKIGGKTYSFGTDGVLKGEVKAGTKTASSSAPVKWGTSHDTIAESVKGSEMFMDMQMMIISGNLDKFNMYIFDDNAKLTMYADMVQGNSVSTYKKSFENKGYKLVTTETEDGATMYVYQKGSDLVVVGYGEEKGTEITMILYFSPDFIKSAGKDFDVSQFAGYMS